MEQKFRSLFDPNRSSVDLRFSIGDPLRSKIYSIYFLWKNFSILIRSSTDHRVDLGSALPCSEPCYSLSLPHDLLPHPFELRHKHYKTPLELAEKSATAPQVHRDAECKEAEIVTCVETKNSRNIVLILYYLHYSNGRAIFRQLLLTLVSSP